MKIEEMLQDYKDAHEIGRLDMFEELAYRYYQKEAELSSLRVEVEKNREIIADANELLWEFTENPNIEMGEVGHNKIEDYFKKYAALNAPSEGQKRD